MPSNPRKKRKLRQGHFRKQTTKEARRKKILTRQNNGVSIPSEAVRKRWNKEKSITHNFKELGLALDVNADLLHDKAKAIRIARPEDDNRPSEVIGELELEAQQVKKYQAYSSQGQVNLIQSFIEKHGTDYVAMAKDLKLNRNQDTPKQIKRKVERYLQTLDRLSQLPDNSTDTHAERMETDDA